MRSRTQRPAQKKHSAPAKHGERAKQAAHAKRTAHAKRAAQSNQPAPRPSASAERRARKDAAGPCPIMRACGGCAWIGMPYRKQLAHKQATIEELFAPLIAQFGWDVAPDAVVGMRADVGDAAREPGYDPLRDGTITAAEGKCPAPRAFFSAALFGTAPIVRIS